MTLQLCHCRQVIPVEILVIEYYANESRICESIAASGIRGNLFEGLCSTCTSGCGIRSGFSRGAYLYLAFGDAYEPIVGAETLDYQDNRRTDSTQATETQHNVE